MGLVRPEFQSFFLPTSPRSSSYCDAPIIDGGIIDGTIEALTCELGVNQFSSVAQLCPTLCDPMDSSTTGLPVHHQLLELAQTHVHQVSDAIQPSHPLSSLLPSIFPSIRVFSNESVLHIMWPEYCSFSFSISPSSIQD